MRTRTKRFGLAVLLSVIYLYSFPYFEKIRSANELPRIYLTTAIVDEGTVAIDSGIERWGTTVDVSPKGGHYYSNKAPGSSFLAVPAYLLVKAFSGLSGHEPSLALLTWTFRVTTGAIPTLLFLLLLWRFLGRFAASPETRRLLLCGYAVGTMAMTYSVLFISHQLAAVCIGTAYIVSVWVIEEGLHARWLMAAGLAAGCAPLVDYQAAFAGVPLAAYLIYKLVGRRDNRQWKHLAMAVAGSLPPILLLLAYHWTAFGSPLRTGYDASEAFAHIHQRGFLGLDAFRFEALFGSTFAPDNGLFVFSPFLLLAIPGWVLLARRKQWWHFGITLSVAFIYLAFISSLVPPFWRGGWQMGPRYITAVLPFLMVPIAVAVSAAETKWVLRSLVVGMIAAAIVIYTLSCAQFPHFPEKFHNPLYELTFRLIGDGLAPPNAGWFIGLRGFASLVPYLLLVGGLIVWIAVPSREHRRSGIAGLVVAAALIASYSLFGGGGEVADQAYEFVRSTYP